MSQSLLLSHSKACAYFAQCDELSCKFSYVLDAKSVLFLFMLYCTVMLRKQLVHYWTMGSYIEWVSSFFAILFWFKTKVGATAISFISLNDYTTMIFLSEAAGKSEEPILTRAWWRFQATIHRRLVHHSVLFLIPMSAQAGRRRR